MDEVILAITEGKRPEYNIVDQLGRLIHKKIVKAYWHSDLLTLIDTIKADEYLDYGAYLRGKSGNEELDTISLDQISSTFLFFDYDPMGVILYGKARGGLESYNRNIASLLELCNDETQRLGKLYVSYPMVEALWHIQPPEGDAKDCVVPLDVLKRHGYKQFIDKKTLLRSQCISEEQWISLLKTHLERNLRFLSISNWDRDTVTIRNQTHAKEARICEIQHAVFALSPFPSFIIDAGNDADWKRLESADPMGGHCPVDCLPGNV